MVDDCEPLPHVISSVHRGIPVRVSVSFFFLGVFFISVSDVDAGRANKGLLEARICREQSSVI